jgi:hypothetical protein
MCESFILVKRFVFCSFLSGKRQSRDLQTIVGLLFLYFLFQFADLPVEPDEVDNYTGKDGGNNSHYDPDFTISPQPVGHLNPIGNGLLSQEILTEQEQSR